MSVRAKKYLPMQINLENTTASKLILSAFLLKTSVYLFPVNQNACSGLDVYNKKGTCFLLPSSEIFQTIPARL